MNLNTIVQSDAFELMASLPDKSIDAIITDLPYGTTACSWDTVIPFAPMWEAVKRVQKAYMSAQEADHAYWIARGEAVAQRRVARNE